MKEDSIKGFYTAQAELVGAINKLIDESSETSESRRVLIDMLNSNAIIFKGIALIEELRK